MPPFFSWPLERRAGTRAARRGQCLAAKVPSLWGLGAQSGLPCRAGVLAMPANAFRARALGRSTVSRGVAQPAGRRRQLSLHFSPDGPATAAANVSRWQHVVSSGARCLFPSSPATSSSLACPFVLSLCPVSDHRHVDRLHRPPPPLRPSRPEPRRHANASSRLPCSTSSR